uniref:Uncharacterized protein n=1 Tax=Aegilops tauschii subsp. strangulata TaxID=200361 RepID=A0A453KTR0_AEGTS
MSFHSFGISLRSYIEGFTMATYFIVFRCPTCQVIIKNSTLQLQNHNHLFKDLNSIHPVCTCLHPAQPSPSPLLHCLQTPW